MVYKRCASCHSARGSAFSLTTYADARPWAKAIKEETLERRMPPWDAVKGFGSFRDDQGLTQQDLELISAWVEGGAPEGDATLTPKPPSAQAPAPVKTPSGIQLIVDGSATLSASLQLAAIRPATIPAGKSVQVLAQLPDGTIDPLIWIYNYNPKFPRTYYLKVPLHLPSGTKIIYSPPSAGAMLLFAVN